MVVTSPVPNDSQEISDFEEVVTDCCLSVECQPGDRVRVNEFLSNGMAGGPLASESAPQRPILG